MGEKQNQPFQLSFNASLKIDFQGSRVTSEGGLILVRELDERLGFGDLIAQYLTDSRRGKNTQLPLADLLRQSVYSRIAGYEDVNDAERLSQDPTFRLIGSEKIWERGAALTRPRCWRRERTSPGWRRSTGSKSWARMSSSGPGPEGAPVFAKPEIYETLEQRGVKYAIRIPANDSLERDIAELLTRPVGRPSHRPVVWYKSSLYRAASWKTARRVVAKVEFHLGELFPRVGFIVTNLETDSRAVVRFYNKRGTAEKWIKEGKQAVKMTRLSCHRFRSNEVRLWLILIAYNLGNLWRRLVLPAKIDNWSLTSLQQRLVKPGGRLVKHARYYWLILAESHLTRRLFWGMVRRIAALQVATG
jgi:hypothetical protein